MNPTFEEKVEMVYQFMQEMKRGNSLPYEVESAIKTRLTGIKSSTKSATSENQAVSEGGSASYSVLKAPDLFLEVTYKGVIYYIPAFT